MAKEIVKNTQNVVAIELMCAAQGLDLFTNLKPGNGTRAAYSAIRSCIPHLKRDRILAKDIRSVTELIKSNRIIDEVEKAVGELK